MSLRLGRLRLRNLRSYEAADVELGPGVTVLTGDVGSGKTSLLHAIEMALFGFAEVDAPFLVRHRTGEASVSLGLSDDGHAYELGRTFKRRTRRGREVFDPEEPTFRVDGELRRYSATEFRQEVIRLLGFPDNPNPRSRSDLWRWAVYTPQERMREILRADEADERLETIRKALELEKYRRAADNSELVAAALRAEGHSHADRAAGMTHFDSDLARAEVAERETSAANDRAEGAAADARRSTAEVEELVARSESERRRRDADRRERDHLEAEATRAAKDAEDAARRAERSRRDAEEKEELARRAKVEPAAVEAAKTAVLAADARLEEGRTELSGLEILARDAAVAAELAAGAERELHALERSRGAETTELADARTALAAAERRGPVKEPTAPTPRSLDEIHADLARLRAEEAAAIATSTARRTEASELAALLNAGVCPRCHQSVDATSFGHHREEAAQGAEDAERALEEVRARLVATEAERGSRERYERTRESWMSREELRLAAADTVARLAQREGNREREVGELRQRVAASRDAAGSARARAAPLDAARKRLAETETARDQARATVASLERDRAAAAGLRVAAEAVRAREGEEQLLVQKLEARRVELRGAIGILAGRLGADAGAEEAHARLLARREAARHHELEVAGALTAAAERARTAVERRAEAAAGAAERRHHVERAAELARWAEFLGGPFRDAVLDIERRLLGRAQALFEREFSRAFTALVEDPGLVARCGPNFVPYVEIDGEMTPAEALSGGERTALALAFRLALGEVVRSAGRLRLDAIVLDEPTDGFSPEQVERMGELLRSLPWGQVVIVTHEAGLAAIADRTVRVRKTGGISTLEGDGVAAPSPPEPTTPRRRGRTARLEPAPPAS